MNMTHFSLLQLPETQQESGSTLNSQIGNKCRSTEVLFNTSQENFLGPNLVCPCVLKKVLISTVIWFPCPSSWENESERKEETTGRYTNSTQEVVAVSKGVCVQKN